MEHGTTLRIAIERIVPGGDGLAFHEGRAVFVPLSAPGDVVDARVTEVRTGYLRADILDLVEASASRVEPACPLYGECGGCNLMHLSREAQASVKLGLFREAFRRTGGLPDIEPVMTASIQFGYRNRAQFHFAPDRSPGYMRRSSRTVVAAPACPILVASLERWLGTEGPTAWKTLSPYMGGKERFAAFSDGASVFLEGPDGDVRVVVRGREFSFHIRGFFQSNLAMLEYLVPAVCQDMSGSRAADLYCGVGLFGAFLSGSFAKLSCIEQDPAAIAYAARNVGRKAEFAASNLEDWVRSPQARAAFDYVVVDPPRSGLAPRVRQWLAASRPPVIGYVSCDPVSLARDAGALVAAGYAIEGARLFDFYPQTAHVESYVRFRLS